MKARVALPVALALTACDLRHAPPPPPPAPTAAEPAATPPTPEPTPPAAEHRYDQLDRTSFNRFAVRADLPIYWIADADGDKQIDPDEVTGLLFYPNAVQPTPPGAFPPGWDDLYGQVVAASKATLDGLTPDEQMRRALVAKELDQGRPTLVRNDFSAASTNDKTFVAHMLKVAGLIDQIYAQQTGAAAMVGQLPPDDPSSVSVFRRNWGPDCVAPATEHEAACSAIPGAPKRTVGVYPPEVQSDATFCKPLEARADAKGLLGPFTVVRESAGKLVAVPYSEAYSPTMGAIADELDAAAADMQDPDEGPLVKYLRAAAASFRSNDWNPADEAWSKMNAENSRWYVRVAPDETYWEPCSLKAGFHLTFALINQGSLEWQRKLAPFQQDMESAFAAHAGAPYKARTVTFHLPDFIDIVVNAGDDRDPLGATIGQSLPNWGPVADSGRGRTVAMSNLYTDPDSIAMHRGQADSLLDAASAAAYVDSPEPGLLSTILHEATHNLGPHAGYEVKGKTDDQAFGGQLASMLEELKAQTGGLFLIEFLRAKGVISDELAAQTYADAVVWAFGHIAEGMYTATGDRKAYSQLAAIQVGFLIDQGALTWSDGATAANGTDHGAFTIHMDKMVAAVDAMTTTVAGIKARGDKAAAEALAARYVDGPTVPQKLIAERVLRMPKANFVYALRM